MNVYKKLQEVRAKLKSVPIKESGNNKFAGYTYMELGDFLPVIVDLCNDAGLCPVVSFADVATLTIVNADAPEEKIVFSSPMSTAELKGCHAIQNLGAVETYLRRYLYVAAFDIVEHDALDSTHGKKEEAKAEQSGSSGQKSQQLHTEPSKAQLDLYDELSQFCNGDIETMGITLDELSRYKEGPQGALDLKSLCKGNSNDKFQKWVGATLGKLRKRAKDRDEIPF